jgi:alanine dehydrogenase
MLHYPTRPNRVQILRSQGINAISMDSIVDDNNMRLVENMRAVAWNGLEAAFDLLEKDCPNLLRKGDPYKILVLGTGMVGKHAIDAATKLGNIERNNRHIELNGPGPSPGRWAQHEQRSGAHARPVRTGDILVDATYRRDPSQAGRAKFLAGLAAATP